MRMPAGRSVRGDPRQREGDDVGARVHPPPERQVAALTRSEVEQRAVGPQVWLALEDPLDGPDTHPFEDVAEHRGAPFLVVGVVVDAHALMPCLASPAARRIVRHDSRRFPRSAIHISAAKPAAAVTSERSADGTVTPSPAATTHPAVPA